MTVHGKWVITIGMGIFTAFGVLSILLSDWRWFIVGGFIFIFSAFTALILSVETKNVSSPQSPTLHHQSPSTNHWRQNTQAQDDWQPPKTPPPDENKGAVAEDVSIDPFYGKQNKDGGTPA